MIRILHEEILILDPPALAGGFLFHVFTHHVMKMIVMI